MFLSCNHVDKRRRAAPYRLVGLRSGLKLCRGMRLTLTEDEQGKVARIIVEEIASQNCRIERGTPATGASGDGI
jgi:hypothetical protein